MTNTVTFAMQLENVIYTGHGLHLTIKQSVIQTWDSYRQSKAQAPESFGVLIGSCNKMADQYCIEAVTSPEKQDKQSRFYFLLKDPAHQDAVDQAYNQSQGLLGYLGTWHTHPEATPTPSRVDINDWLSCVKRNPDRLLFFVIVGTRDICVFMQFRNKFEQLEIQESNSL